MRRVCQRECAKPDPPGLVADTLSQRRRDGLPAHNSCLAPQREREAASWSLSAPLIGGRGGAWRLTLEPLSQNAVDAAGSLFITSSSTALVRTARWAGVAFDSGLNCQRRASRRHFDAFARKQASRQPLWHPLASPLYSAHPLTSSRLPAAGNELCTSVCWSAGGQGLRRSATCLQITR